MTKILVATNKKIFDILIAETNKISGVGGPGDGTEQLAGYREHPTEYTCIMNYEAITGDRCNGNKKYIIDCIAKLVHDSPDLTLINTELEFSFYCLENGFYEVES